MDANQSLNRSFNYGDVVVIKQDAPLCYKPGSWGSICGVRTIDNLDTSQRFKQPLNSKLYLIEFDDGETLEIPQKFLTI